MLEESRRRSGSLLLVPPPPPGTVVAPVFERFHNFKDFMALQKDSLEPERAVELYAQYQFDFRVHSARTQFASNLEVGFVRERFNPEPIAEIAKQKVRMGRQEAVSFLEQLRQGSFNELKLEVAVPAGSIRKEGQQKSRVLGIIDDIASLKSETFHGDNVTAPPFFATNLNAGGRTLVLKKLPPDVQRCDIVDACEKVAGIVSITLMPSCLVYEHASRLQDQAGSVDQAEFEKSLSDCYVRSRGSFFLPLQTCWIEFVSAEACDAAEVALERMSIGDLCTGHPLRVQADPQQLKRARVVSGALPDGRLEKDLESTQALILKLDADFGIYGPDVWPVQQQAPVETMTEETVTPPVAASGSPDPALHPFLNLISSVENSTLRLDLQITYLRRVHALDYYAAKVCWSHRELFENVGSVTLRANVSVDHEDVAEDNASSGAVSASSLSKEPVDYAAFDAKIDALLQTNFTHWTVPVNEEHPVFVDMWNRFCVDKTLLVDAEKFRCGICRKLFRGAEFVHKHLRNKHATEIEPVMQQVKSAMMKVAFEAEDAKLLLFGVTNSPTSLAHEAASTSGPWSAPRTGGHPLASGGPLNNYGPQRRMRTGNNMRSESARPYRDWDAPRSRLLEKSGGGTFRTMIRYDDL